MELLLSIIGLLIILRKTELLGYVILMLIVSSRLVNSSEESCLQPWDFEGFCLRTRNTYTGSSELYCDLENTTVSHEKTSLQSQPSEVESIPNLNIHFKEWMTAIRLTCQGKMTFYTRMMLQLKNVIMNRHYSSIQPLDDNLNNIKDAEEYKLARGFFQLPCGFDRYILHFGGGSGYLHQWEESLKYILQKDFQTRNSQENVFNENQFTIALMRYESTNVYWTVMDLYNVYLTIRFFNISLNETNVLLIDKRPESNLDNLFKTVYNVKQLHEYPMETIFQNLILMYFRTHGPLLKPSYMSIPFIQDFRNVVLGAFQLADDRKPNCDALKLLFIWRRNYIISPGQPATNISRKFKNEEQIIYRTKEMFPSIVVRGVQLDNFTIKEQLALISATDILIGMHGAALAYAIFMPSGAGVIELYPYHLGTNWHMRYLHKQAGLHYRFWENKDSMLEDENNMFITVPPEIITNLIKGLLNKMCR